MEIGQTLNQRYTLTARELALKHDKLERFRSSRAWSNLNPDAPGFIR